MAGSFLLTMELTKHGHVRGSSTKHEGGLDDSTGMECHSFSHSVATPVDPNSGSGTGKRTHRPITVTKDVDGASPILWHAQCTNEGFTKVKFHFNSDPDGQPCPRRTIELTVGRILSIRPATHPTGKQGEQVTLTYEGMLVNGIPSDDIPDFYFYFSGGRRK
jgi:type VI secretion system Hcp family effector